MSVSTEISRLESAKAAIISAIEGKEVTVPDGTKLDGLAALIESIEAGGGGSSVKDFFFSTITLLGFNGYMDIPWPNIPDVLVIVGPVSGGYADHVGLAIHIKDVDGGVYQEKWRYQSTKYLVGTSAADGSLFTLSENNDKLFRISINSGETSYGKVFGQYEYRIFAAKMF